MHIKQAAIKDESGVVYTLPIPARHNDIFRVIIGTKEDEANKRLHLCVQGFILDDDTFVDRVEAGKIAIEFKQIVDLKWPPQLYSEDLW